MRALLLVGLLTISVGCAKVNPALVAAEDAIYQSVTKVDDELRKVCADAALAAPCADARPVMLELLGAGKAFNRSVAEQKISGLTDVIVVGGRLAEKVKALPQGQTVQIVMALARAIAAAASQAGGQ
jgi:hypothetical protein